jgi:ATP-dependent Clp endopeptidase proteolytic subunit ClpP
LNWAHGFLAFNIWAFKRTSLVAKALKIQAFKDHVAIFVNGVISSVKDEEGKVPTVSFADFSAEFKSALNGFQKAKIYLNSPGGNVMEGFAMYDLITQSGVDVEIQVVGIAASMASIFLQAGSKRTISPNARIMIHRPTSGAEGDADQLANSEASLRDLEDKMLAVYVKRSGRPEAEVKAWMQTGADKWFNAQEALAAGLVDAIVEVQGANMRAIAEHDTLTVYRAAANLDIFKNQIQFNSIMKKQWLTALAAFAVAHSLTAESSEGEFAAVAFEHAQALKGELEKAQAEVSKLQTQLEAEAKAKVTHAVAQAKADGRIGEDEVADWTQALTDNFENGLKLLNKQAKPVDINAQLTGARGQAQAQAQATELKTDQQLLDKYFELSNTKGAVAKFAKEQPEVFEKMIDALKKSTAE